MRSKAITALALVGMWVGFNSNAKAALTFELGGMLNGVTPTSSAPWLTAQFNNVEGGVELTLTSQLSVPSEFISAVALNVNVPGLKTADIQTDTSDPLATWMVDYSNVDLAGAGSLGSGFDILISWDSAQGVQRFNGTDVDTFKFTFAGLTENDFNAPNASGVFIAAHVQGIPLPGGGTTSGAITVVPEPTTILAGALLLLPIGASTIRILRRNR